MLVDQSITVFSSSATETLESLATGKLPGSEPGNHLIGNCLIQIP